MVRRSSKSVMRPKRSGGSTPQALRLAERTVSDELTAMEKSTVFWRTETSSLSDGEDSSFFEESSSSTLLVRVLEPTSASAEELRRRNEQLLEIPVSQQESYTVETGKDDKAKESIYVDVDLEKYMSTREMTPLQERMNALTMIPAPLFCIAFALSGSWMSSALVADATRDLEEQGLTAFEDSNTCINWSSLPNVGGWIFQNLHAIPPLPVLAILLGLSTHAPFSFLYHWKYAHRLSPAKRTNHWSRRLDQSMLHVSSALTAYGTSGAWNFFLVNAMFNIDCVYRQFEPLVRPRRNQGRLGVAIVAWTIPILKRGDLDTFFQVIAILAFGIYLFIRYPIGGWSHAAFHIVLLPLMPMLMQIALGLESSQDQLKGAARCFALAEHRSNYS